MKKPDLFRNQPVMAIDFADWPKLQSILSTDFRPLHFARRVSELVKTSLACREVISSPDFVPSNLMSIKAFSCVKSRQSTLLQQKRYRSPVASTPAPPTTTTENLGIVAVIPSRSIGADIIIRVPLTKDSLTSQHGS